MKYALIDTANTFFRARHVVRGDLDTKVGMAFHITLNSLKKIWHEFDADHIVFCLEGRSWRKDFYEPYKRNRQEFRDALTPSQQEEEKVFWETFDAFKEFVTTKTNCTVLQHSQLEADDLIAGWIQLHPEDEHVIVSIYDDSHEDFEGYIVREKESSNDGSLILGTYPSMDDVLYTEYIKFSILFST